MLGLDTLAQVNFAAGMFRGVARHLIPESGVYEARNVLTDDDGSLYKRGGSAYLSTSGLGTTGLTFLWDGYLAAGRRTVVADTAKFGVLDGAEAMVDLGGSGLAAPVRAVEIGGVLVIGGGTMYAGSRKAADYSVATVTATNGSAVVTGAATAWAANADAGMLFKRSGDARYYVVQSVDSDTQITLTEPYQGVTGAGAAYALTRLGTAPKISSFYAVVGDRLVSLSGQRIDFSNGRDASGNLQWQTFSATDYHRLPEGCSILGGTTLRDTLFAFTTQGIFSVSNMVYNLTDAFGNVQQRLEHINHDLILWANEGIAAWQGSLVVPATDGVWLFDGVSAPTRISQSIADLYIGYVRGSDKLGLGHAFHNHYFLPVISSTGGFVDLLVCRLDRAQRSPIGEIFPWTHFDGAGGKVAAFDVRIGTSPRQPQILGASLGTDSRVVDCSYYFDPDGAHKADHDGTVHEFDVITRDFSPGRLNVRGLVRRLRARYELVDAAADDPTLSAYYSVGVVQSGLALWGTAVWGTDKWADALLASAVSDVQLSGQAPESDGRDPYTWGLVNVNTRRIRFRLRSSKPAASLILRTLELFVRPSGRSA